MDFSEWLFCQVFINCWTSSFKLLLMRQAFFVNITSKKIINWELIHDAYLISIHKQVIACLVADEQFEPSYHQGPYKQKMAKLSRAMGFQGLNISLANVDVNPERLAEFVLEMRSVNHEGRPALLRKQI